MRPDRSLSTETIDALIDELKSSVPNLHSTSRSHVEWCIRERNFEVAPVIARLIRRGVWEPWSGEPTPLEPLPSESGYRDPDSTRQSLTVRSSDPVMTLILLGFPIIFFTGLAIGKLDTTLAELLLFLLVILPAWIAGMLQVRQSLWPRTMTMIADGFVVDDVRFSREDVIHVTCVHQMADSARRAMSPLEWVCGVYRAASWCILATLRGGDVVVLARDLDQKGACAGVLALEAELFAETKPSVRTGIVEEE